MSILCRCLKTEMNAQFTDRNISVTPVGSAVGVCDEFHRRRLNNVRRGCIVGIVNDGGTNTNNYALNV